MKKRGLQLLKKAVCFLIVTGMIALFKSEKLQAQNIANYTLTGGSFSYAALSGATNPSLTAGTSDDGYFNGIPIGFEFIYMGVPYTNLAASTNGWMKLGSPITNSENTSNLTSGGGTRPVLAPLWDDLDIQAATNVSYKTTGTAPNRVFTIEYKDVKWDYNFSLLVGLGSATISFQTKLYETSGKIEFNYNPLSLAGPNNPSASIGITGVPTGSGNFLSISTISATPGSSTTTETDNLGTRPASNRLFTFAPPATVPIAPSSLTFSAVTSSSMTLSWTDNSSNETNFIIYRSTDNVTFTYSSQVAANATSSVQTGLAASTLYYWRVYAVTEARPSATPATGNRITCWSTSQVPLTNIISYYKFAGNANDASGNFNNGTLQNSPTLTADRFGNTNNAYAFNGTNQYISTSNQYVNPNNLTVSIWFKTTTVAGGKLIGFGSVPVGASFNFDRHIYMSNTGQLLFGVNPSSGRKTITSPLTYNDGSWHHAAASLSSTNGIKLYVDGVLVATDATPLAGETYNGYWKIGYDEIGTTWPSNPTSTYFNGSLDDVLIYQTELNATTITTLYNASDGVTSNSPVCPGSSLDLAVTGVSGATYSWTGPNSFSSSSQNPSLAYSLLYAGTYAVIISQGGCTQTAYTIATTNTTLAGRWMGSVSSNWSTVGNWCNNVVPTTVTDVVIPSTAPIMPAVGGTANMRNITISTSASLTKSTSAVINIYGNLVNNGSYIDNSIYSSSGVVNFLGTTQSITGATTFNNITLNNASTLSMNSPVTINAILTLTSGTLNTNGNLTQNLYTGAIAGTGTGAISGNVNFVKTIWGDRYHYISSPITGMTAADWNDDVTIKFGANRNLFSYSENIIDTNKLIGWTPFTVTSTSLQAMTGYALFFPRWIYNTTFDVTGAYSHSTTYSNSSLSNTASAKPSSDGWNLIGNPYPSSIDWIAASGWTKTGLDNAIYTWDGRTNRFASYVAGVGTNGGSRYLGSMQAFFIKVTSPGTGTLSMNNNVRVTSTLLDVWRTDDSAEEKILRLNIANGDLSDETIIRLTKDASVDFDAEKDAYKLLSSDETPSLYSLSPGADYSINSLPDSIDQLSIPLQLTVAVSGNYTFHADLNNFTTTENVFLEDRLLSISQNLSESPDYTLNLQTSDYTGRFFIVYKKENNVTGIETAGSAAIEIGAYHQSVFVNFKEEYDGNANVTIVDALGKTVFKNEQQPVSSSKLTIDLNDVNTGVYLVKIQTPTYCRTQSVFLQK